MAVTNAQKIFNFAIEIDGVDQLLIQEVKMPETEVGVVEHGASNHNIKTPGGVAVSAAELKKIKPATSSDDFVWDWLEGAQNMNTGSGGLNYKRTVVFKELGPTGNVLNAWLWRGAWCSKHSTSDFKRGKQDENVMETATIQIDTIQKII